MSENNSFENLPARDRKLLENGFHGWLLKVVESYDLHVQLVAKWRRGTSKWRRGSIILGVTIVSINE